MGHKGTVLEATEKAEVPKQKVGHNGTMSKVMIEKSGGAEIEGGAQMEVMEKAQVVRERGIDGGTGTGK